MKESTPLLATARAQLEEQHPDDSSLSQQPSNATSYQTNYSLHNLNTQKVKERVRSDYEDNSNGDDGAGPSDESAVAKLQRARRYLYVSHCLSQFSEVAWQFALTLFLAAFVNYQSLVLVSTYGLCSGLIVFLFSSKTGTYVDGTNRLKAAQYFIGIENVSVLIATGFCYLLLSKQQQGHDDQKNDDLLLLSHSVSSTSNSRSRTSLWHNVMLLIHRWFPHIPLDPFSIVCIVSIHAFGSLAQLLDQGFLVAVERDWVVILSRSSGLGGSNLNQQKQWLSETNVIMKQIDLACKVLAPAVAGWIVGMYDRSAAATLTTTSDAVGHDLTGAAILVGIVNVVSLIVEYICTHQIYYLIPELAVKAAKVERTEEPHARANSSLCGGWFRRSSSTSPLRIYLSQPISPAGLALALLYLNSLTFGAIMTAYLVWRGMRVETVGMWRGISAAVGLCGTFTYHVSVKRFAVVTTGQWSIVFQLVFVTISFVALHISHYQWSMALLIVGVCASRIGLYVFDISVTQLMQEFVEEDVRGVVGGTQKSLNAFFMLLSFALGLVFPDPKDFPMYIAAGYAALIVANMFYFAGVFRKADHFLLHSET